MEPITDRFELELSFSVPSAVLPFISCSSFIPLLVVCVCVCVFAGSSHLVCTSILSGDGAPVFFFLEQSHIYDRL